MGDIPNGSEITLAMVKFQKFHVAEHSVIQILFQWSPVTE